MGRKNKNDKGNEGMKVKNAKKNSRGMFST